MEYRINSLDSLTEYFRRLPGIGAKLARKLAFHVIGMNDEQVQGFADALLAAKRTVHKCPVCQNLTDLETCSVCTDSKRDRSIICVVKTPQNVISIENTHEYNGMYHVLHGLISPMDGIGPEDLHVKELLQRLRDETVKEVIIATDPTVEGDTTALYLSKIISSVGVKVTRLAFGIPIGSDIEFADSLTLTKAIENRREL